MLKFSRKKKEISVRMFFWAAFRKLEHAAGGIEPRTAGVRGWPRFQASRNTSHGHLPAAPSQNGGDHIAATVYPRVSVAFFKRPDQRRDRSLFVLKGTCVLRAYSVRALGRRTWRGRANLAERSGCGSTRCRSPCARSARPCGPHPHKRRDTRTNAPRPPTTGPHRPRGASPLPTCVQTPQRKRHTSSGRTHRPASRAGRPRGQSTGPPHRPHTVLHALPTVYSRAAMVRG